MKFCKDCANHFIYYNMNRCYAPENGINLVTGEIHDKSCDIQRSVGVANLKGYCGEVGLFFKPKQ